MGEKVGGGRGRGGSWGRSERGVVPPLRVPGASGSSVVATRKEEINEVAVKLSGFTKPRAQAGRRSNRGAASSKRLSAARE